MYKDLTSKNIYSWDYNELKTLKYFDSLHTYKYGFLRAFYEKYHSKIEEELNNNTNTVEKIEKENFVFIIDEINRGEISKFLVNYSLLLIQDIGVKEEK